MTNDEITDRLRRGLNVTRAESGNPPPTCKEIATKVGVGHRTVSRINHKTSIGNAVAIAGALGVPVGHLLRYLLDDPEATQ
jgi:transcriptional regulator with XRE-family HTH domain